MTRISTHSGLPEAVELAQMERRAAERREKRESQLAAIYNVLDRMPDEERRAIIAQVIRHYRRMNEENTK